MTRALEFSTLFIAMGGFVQNYVIINNKQVDEGVPFVETIWSVPNLVALAVALLYIMAPKGRWNKWMFKVPGEEPGKETYDEAKRKCGYVSAPLKLQLSSKWDDLWRVGL